jgi:hypothetical protein
MFTLLCQNNNTTFDYWLYTTCASDDDDKNVCHGRFTQKK